MLRGPHTEDVSGIGLPLPIVNKFLESSFESAEQPVKIKRSAKELSISSTGTVLLELNVF